VIPRECKRLAEVDFPIAEVSRHSVREKSIRHGHPSTLHLWWARRPLASSRAVLMALLLPDPCDPHCPEAFKQDARRILLGMHGRPKGWTEVIESDVGLRRVILKFVADFANWDRAADRSYVEVGRALVKAAHGADAPLVVDPFAGGGSIPLEALRLGCEAFASDLNPVACLILKVMLEDIPRHGSKLADELRKVGGEVKRQAERELADLYPADPDGATPIAYLWARTVRCEAPSCGAEIPLMRSFWLCRKPKRKRALRYRIERPEGAAPRVEFEVYEPETDREVCAATVTNAKATCLCCGAVLPPDRVRAQLAAERGGADVIFDAEGSRIGGARMTAVVTLRPGETGRHYRLPAEPDYGAVRLAQTRIAGILDEWERNLPAAQAVGRRRICPVPDEPINPIRPSPNARGLSAVTRYGMATFGDLFTARQKAALMELGRLLSNELEQSSSLAVALLLGRMSDFLVSSARWKADAECPVQALARQALPVVWDFAEACPWSDATGSALSQANRMADAVESACIPFKGTGQVQPADATNHPLPDQAADIWFTDPPYYDAIPYADLADFFLVWLKRMLPEHTMLRDPLAPENLLSPKTQECVWNQAYEFEGRPKDAAFFESTISKAFQDGRRILSEEGIASIVFAHQTTQGWEAFLGGLVSAGWTVTVSWPIATEMASRIRARDNASLATSVHLICRPRPENAPVGDWADILRELPRRVGTDGYRIHHQATLKKVVSDRRASLDEETEVRPAIRKLVEGEFRSRTTLPLVFFPGDGAAVQDSPRLTLVVLDPETEWTDGGGQVAERIGRWTKTRGESPRLYPGSLVWCARKPGRELRDRVELWLAWRRVEREVAEGVLGAEYDRADRLGVQTQVKDAEEAARDEVWAGYRFVALAGDQEKHGLEIIDLGAGHASANDTLCGRIVGALKAEALLNESVGAGYIDRHWPPAFKDTAAWPLTSLRQSFLNGALTRLTDPDAILRRQIVEFVSKGDFGLASGAKKGCGFERLWYAESVRPEEVAFEPDVYLLTKAKAEALNVLSGDGSGSLQPEPAPSTEPKPGPQPEPAPGPKPEPLPDPAPHPGTRTTTLQLAGTIPPEVWNRLGTRILPKLRSGDDLSVGIELSVSVDSQLAGSMETDLRQILDDLGLGNRVRVERIQALETNSRE